MSESADKGTGIDHSTELALQRTYLAYERTLMAWVRTATSLFAFGFTVYKFFEYLTQVEGARITNRLLGPRQFALGMMGIGILTLAFATLQHRHALKMIEVEYSRIYPSLAGKLAAVMLVVGIALLVIVLFGG